MPLKIIDCPDKATLETLLHYNSETGAITWKKNLAGPVKAGMIAGSKHTQGYITIGFQGSSYLAHRLAWVIFYGSLDQSMQVDHANNIKTDNRICNLRLSSHAENCRNSAARKHNGSAMKGVKHDKRAHTWGARITTNGVVRWLGTYQSAEDAHAAYRKAAIELHKEFANFG